MAIDSGFGPYGLTRLCYATKGIYFAVHPNRPASTGPVKDTAAMATRISQFFDPDVMRNYLPDYVSSQQYDQIVKAEHEARIALVEAANMAMVDPMERPRTRFQDGRSGVERELDQAQQASGCRDPSSRSSTTCSKGVRPIAAS